MLPEFSKLLSPTQTWECDFCGPSVMYQEPQGRPPRFRKNLVGGGARISWGWGEGMQGMSGEKEEPASEGLGNPQESDTGINYRRAPCSSLFPLSDKMNQCFYFFFFH